MSLMLPSATQKFDQPLALACTLMRDSRSSHALPVTLEYREGGRQADEKKRSGPECQGDS